jgi:acid phosphatase
VITQMHALTTASRAWRRRTVEDWVTIVRRIGIALLSRRYALLLVVAVLLAAAPSSAAPAVGVPRLSHVVVVVLENLERPDVVGSTDAPYLNSLRRRYADLTSYTAVSHPSLPNYLALVSGSTHGITDDCTTCSAAGPSIGTLLSARHLAWGGYAQGYPSSPRFAKKHMPFLYFAGQAGHVHPLGALDPRRLPAYAFVAPDLCDDAHDCALGVADRFLSTFLPPLLRVPSTAVFVVFDEGTTDAGGGGHVFAAVAGTAVRPHSVFRRPTSHYGLLRTVEDASGLRRLGASARALPITGIWR